MFNNISIKTLPFFIAFLFLAHSGFTIEITKNISYSSQNTGTRNLLDVYYPGKTTKGNADVIVFIHGGSWRSGSKDTYTWLAKNFVRKGYVAVIINYSLTPEFNYEQMGYDCAKAIKWAKENIAGYGGNPSRIFVMGHSAGGHLAELINADPRYFKAEGIANPIHGVILNDAFGLDLFQYLSTYQGDNFYRDFTESFTTNPEVWKQQSPLMYKANIANPHLILIGGDTYPSIQIQSGCLYEYLLAKKVPVKEIWRPGKKHIGMISWMFLSWSPQYKMIKNFTKLN